MHSSAAADLAYADQKLSGVAGAFSSAPVPTGGAGARIIYDAIAGPLLDKLADVAAPGATIFEYGLLSGEPTPFPLIPALQKGLTIRGYWLWETVKSPETFAKAKSYVYERVKHRDFQPKIAKTFRFEGSPRTTISQTIQLAAGSKRGRRLQNQSARASSSMSVEFL
jgi:NADPH:quinone reductase-like Zn-dependent oxidoreductase